MASRAAAAVPPAPAARSMIYLGKDVHKDSITIAVLPALAKAPTRLEQLANDLPKRQKWITRVARDGEIHASDEASGAGYVTPSRHGGVGEGLPLTRDDGRRPSHGYP